MSFTNVLKYGLVSQGVACIPDTPYNPILPTLAAGDFKTMAATSWTTLSTWNVYSGDTWIAATKYPTQVANQGYVNILHNVYFLPTTNINDGYIVNAAALTAISSKIINVAKNIYLINGGRLIVNSSRNLYCYLRGDLVLISGIIGSITSTGTGNLEFHICGGKVQQYYADSITYNRKVQFFIKDNSIFKMDNYIIPSTCTGAFTLNAGCGLIIGSPSGITSSGAAGNIQTTGTRTFSTGADYTYNMSNGTQYTGNGLPTTVRNLSFTGCKKTMVLSNNITVTGTYTINPSVKVNLNGFTLTLP